MTDPEPDFSESLRDLIRSVNKQANDAEAARAKADPVRYKLSRVMEGKHGLRFRYWPGGRDGRGRTVDFCWTTHRNVAGYFLTWRQVMHKDGSGTRDQWAARKTRWKAREMAERRADAFRAKQAQRRKAKEAARG